jgi:flagellar biosynthesis component FlhA
LEAIADGALTTKSLIFLTETVRRRLGPSIAEKLTSHDGKLYAALLDPACEEALRSCVIKSEHDIALAPDLATAQGLLTGIQSAVETLGMQGHRPVLVAPADLRYPFWKFAHRFLPQVVVVAQQELPPRLEVAAVATVSHSSTRSSVGGGMGMPGTFAGAPA